MDFHSGISIGNRQSQIGNNNSPLPAEGAEEFMTEAIETKQVELATQPQTYINELVKHVGEEVTLKGWLYNMRSSGKLMFPQLRDGTGVVQCVVVKNAVA